MGMKDVQRMKKYSIGPSRQGILAVALVMLPNLVYAVYRPASNPLAQGNAAALWLDIAENIGRFGVMLSLAFVVNRVTAPRTCRTTAYIAASSLAAYYALWVCYFLGVSGGPVLLGLAVFPSVFFFDMAYRLRNLPAMGFAGLFALAHIAVTVWNHLV